MIHIKQLRRTGNGYSIAIPTALADDLGVSPGDSFVVYISGDDSLTLKVVSKELFEQIIKNEEPVIKIT